MSGVEDDHPGAVAAAAEWVVRFVRSGLVAPLEAPEYLTVSLPVGTPASVKGARIVDRARGTLWGRSSPIREGTEPDSVVEWRFEFRRYPEERSAPGSDVRAVAEGYIAIVPMRVDEFDAGLAARLRGRADAIPAWVPADGGGRDGRASVPR